MLFDVHSKRGVLFLRYIACKAVCVCTLHANLTSLMLIAVSVSRDVQGSQFVSGKAADRVCVPLT